jgi:hypothetical protein
MRPSLRQLANALGRVVTRLETPTADYCFEGRFRFALDNGWSLVLSPDDAGRFRLDACLRSRVRATMWCAADDHERLDALVLAARDEAAALVA